MKRKLRLSKETVRALGSAGLDIAAGGSRVRCGGGTYAGSCIVTCNDCPSIHFQCITQGGNMNGGGDTCFTCPI